MKNAEQLIGGYHRVFLICAVLALCFLGAAVVLFLVFRVPEAVGSLTRWTAKKAMKESRKRGMFFAFVLVWALSGRMARAEKADTVLTVDAGVRGEDYQTGYEGDEAWYFAGKAELKFGVELLDFADIRERLFLEVENPGGTATNSEFGKEFAEGTEGYTKGVCLEQEGEYTLRVGCRPGENGQEVDELYASPRLIVDNTAPEVTARWINAEGEELERDEFYQKQEELYVDVQIREKYLDTENTKLFLAVTDSGGKTLDCPERTDYGECSWKELAGTKAEDGIYSLRLELKTEANYRLYTVVRDKAGHYADSPENGETDKMDTAERRILLGNFCLDRTPPQIDAGDIICRAEKQSFLEKLIEGVTFGSFCQPVMKVTIQAMDQASGVAEISYSYGTVYDDEGKEIESVAGMAVRENGALLQKEGSSCFYTELLLPQSFRGTVRAKARDLAGHEMEIFTESIGLLSESEEIHRKTSEVRVSLVGGEGKKEGFYRGDVQVLLELQDTFSGIAAVDFQAGNDWGTEEYRTAGEEILTELRRTHTLPAEENHRNQVPLAVVLTDHAGHQTRNEVTPLINIDTAAPRIEVNYDNNEVRNEKYYRAERTATIIVTERNFDPDDIELELTGRSVPALSWAHQPGSGCSGSGEPSDLRHADSCRWCASIPFEEDGEYSLGFSCTDAAGNRGSLGRTDEFVIDKTAPVLEVTFDNHRPLHEKYYNSVRHGVIRIVEKNFRAGDVEATVTATDREKPVKPPTVGGFMDDGAEHRALVNFSYDGVFTMEVEYTDLAGNVAQPVKVEEFIIDRTAPVLTFFDIVEHSANNGEVAPGICCSDTNYDAEAMEVSLEGSNRGILEPEAARSLGADQICMKLRDFEQIPENDDLYRMAASAVDLAGNRSEAEIRFSVNRFGSVYVLDEETEKLAGAQGNRFTNQEQDIVIEEYNTDTLETMRVTYSRDGEVTTLKQGRDYTVQESGNEYSWKTYIYRIEKENFEQEGAYVVTVCSEDRATNLSNNQIKEKSVEFVIDKTPPSIVLTGIESGKQYQADSRKVLIDVRDAISLGRVELYLNDRLVKTCEKEELHKNPGLFSYQIPSQNFRQNVVVCAWDAAGNENFTEPMDFLVTSNLLVQFLMNRRAVTGACLVLAAGIAAAGFWFCRKKQKK